MSVQAFKSVLVLFAICFVSASEWKTIDFNGLFTFRLPAAFTKRTSTGPEDVRAEFYKGATRLIIVWGHTESPAYNDRRQQSMNDYHESNTRLRGKRANIRTYQQAINSKRTYLAELNVGNWEQGEVQLYMRLESDDPAMLDVADQIFKSITFPIPAPDRSFKPNGVRL